MTHVFNIHYEASLNGQDEGTGIYQMRTTGAISEGEKVTFHPADFRSAELLITKDVFQDNSLVKIKITKTEYTGEEEESKQSNS